MSADLLTYLWLLPVVWPAVGFFFCCCTSTACASTDINFDDDTYGSLTNTGTDPPWELDNTEYPDQVVYTAATDAELLWTKPIVDTGGRAYYHAEADVESGHGATDNDAGGVTIVGPDWQAWCGVEDGFLVLRFSNDDGDSYETTGANVITPARISLTVQTREGCPGYASIFGDAGVGSALSLTVAHNVEITLPGDIDMGIWVPVTESDAPPPIFPDCCPADENCYSGYTATGTLFNFPGGHTCTAGSAASMTYSTSNQTIASTDLNTILAARGFSAANGYLYGGADLFDDGFSAFPSWGFVVWCDDTNGLQAAAIDSTGTESSFGFSTISSSCDPFSWEVEWSQPTDGCGTGGLGSFRIEFAGTVGSCPVDARAFDNVSLSACGGSTDPQDCETENSSTSCFGCDPFPRCWRMEISGLTDGGCCDTYNREWIFDLHSADSSRSICLIRPSAEQDFPPACNYDGGTGHYEYGSFYDAGDGTIKVGFSTGFSTAPTLWSMNAIDFDCNGPNTLTLEQVGPGCTTWPATVTIEPWECLVVG